MSLNINEKKTGDLLTASEFNQVVSAVNENADGVSAAKTSAAKAAGDASTALTTAKAAKQSADESAGKVASAVSDAVEAAKSEVSGTIYAGPMTEAEYAAAVTAGTIDNNILYLITEE